MTRAGAPGVSDSRFGPPARESLRLVFCRRRRARQPRRPRAAASAAAVAAALAIAAAAACRGREGQGAPRVFCAEPARDLGSVPEADRVAHTFAVANHGRAPLLIEAVDASPPCAAAPGVAPASIPPGGVLALPVACDTRGHPPRLVERIVVRSNDPTTSRLTLTLSARVVPALAFDPALVRLEVTAGSSGSTEVRLVGPRAKAARPAVEAVDDGGPQVRVVEGGDGSPARIVITLAGNRVGVRAGRIQIRTGLAEPELLSLPYWLSVRGALAVSPTNPYFNLRDPEARRQLLTVTSARAGFRLFAASVDGPFLASFKRVAGSAAYAVSVSVDERRVPADVRGVTGRLVLVSNDPAEPRKEIPLFGMGAVVGP